ncbi:transporter substrate-binding domain-containing protein [Sinorhizobium fredii]|uniref:Transporter substrate-binding domain-containing protein n=1 Tax=Rhizobium fredii TaxID=380 RepID=A0A844AGK5_RHIFR|nr:transporter substrate-binding domain-containing protein [Sinorhizobium fredii]AWM27628.1 Lysine-arginine-ornithine-binding periplasmic protein precursor [Sinorhizobium fredii CCBAU 25509]MQW96589.1 transporter substrate-binding domain-containing protein [Sinorhizobium fredii]MQX11677.1 transporter substrate-binding domain-containing protein [Sinorhizobium fredii]UTY45473.1 transporter substrate-binding domain-containing protein [Sinorhizobium fredii]
MRKIELALASMVLGAIATGSAHAQSKPTEITIATEGAYEPWNFTGPDGKLAGFEIDLANDLCGRMKIKCNIVAQDWDGLIPSLIAKKFDVIMASMIVTEKRLGVISFSEPYAPTAAAFMVEKSGPLANLPGTGATIDLAGDKAKVEQELQPLRDALNGKAVGAQVSTANVAFLDTYFKDVVDPREYKTVEQHDLDLQAGRIDAVIAQKTSLTATLSKEDFKDYTIAGPTFTGGVFGQGIAAGVRKDDTELKAMLDEAIRAAKSDGTINKLAQKWMKIGLE